jgi:hypothetical protein
MMSGRMCLAKLGSRLTTPGKRSSVCATVVILLSQNSSSINPLDTSASERENEAYDEAKDAHDKPKDHHD